MLQTRGYIGEIIVMVLIIIKLTIEKTDSIQIKSIKL